MRCHKKNSVNKCSYVSAALKEIKLIIEMKNTSGPLFSTHSFIKTNRKTKCTFYLNIYFCQILYHAVKTIAGFPESTEQ